jgi:hypothetical protein
LASSNDKHTVWIGGDFNLPEINWEDLDNIHVKENSKKADIHQEFKELTTNCGFLGAVFILTGLVYGFYIYKVVI